VPAQQIVRVVWVASAQPDGVIPKVSHSESSKTACREDGETARTSIDQKLIADSPSPITLGARRA
jgi:hypothetical protein